MKAFCIVVLAFFFSLGFSQELEPENLQAQPQPASLEANSTAPEAYSAVLGYEATNYSKSEENALAGKAAANDAAQKSSDGLSWHEWVGIATFTLAVVSGVGAALKHSDAVMYKKDIDELKDNARNSGFYDGGPNADIPEKEIWKAQYRDRKDGFEKNELYRNILGISAGVFATACIVTFFF